MMKTTQLLCFFLLAFGVFCESFEEWGEISYPRREGGKARDVLGDVIYIGGLFPLTGPLGVSLLFPLISALKSLLFSHFRDSPQVFQGPQLLR